MSNLKRVVGGSWYRSLLVLGMSPLALSCASQQAAPPSNTTTTPTSAPSEVAATTRRPPPSTAAATQPPCLAADDTDDATLAARIRASGVPGQRVGFPNVTVLDLPQMSPQLCEPITLGVSKFRVTVRYARPDSEHDYSFAVEPATAFTVDYDGRAQSVDDERLSVFTAGDFECVGALRIVYLGSEPLTVDELPDTLEVHFYGGFPFGSVSGPVPVDEFKTDRVIIGEVDYIKVETCGQD